MRRRPLNTTRHSKKTETYANFAPTPTPTPKPLKGGYSEPPNPEPPNPKPPNPEP